MLVSVLLGGRAEAASGAAFTVSLSSTSPNIGKVASASSGTTNFVVDAATGSVSTSGPGQFIPYNAARTALTTITINCAGGTKCSNPATVTITSGSATGRAQPISAWSADFTGGATATLTNGQTSASSNTSSLSFTIDGVGNNSSKSFHLGLTLPIASTGTLGAASAGYTVSVSATQVTSGSGSAAAGATVEGSLSISKGSDLSFGTLVLTAGQSGAATWSATNQTWTLSGGATSIHAAPTIAKFTVSGTPSQQIQFSVPSTIRMSKSNGDYIDVTVATNGQGTQLLNGQGKFSLYVGGQISFTDSTPTGAYSGLFTVTANYQ